MRHAVLLASVVGVVVFLVLASGGGGGAAPPAPAAPAAPGGAAAAAGPEQVRWAFLQRPMQSPRRGIDTSCPSGAPLVYEGIGRFSGTGPVYTSTGPEGEVGVAFRPGEFEEWGGQKFAFLVDPGYRGEVLVRGAGYAGDARLGFGPGAEPALEWLLGLEGDASTTGLPEGARLYVTYLRASRAGCYYLQFDGLDFSQRAVIQVYEATD